MLRSLKVQGSLRESGVLYVYLPKGVCSALKLQKGIVLYYGVDEGYLVLTPDLEKFRRFEGGSESTH